MAHVAAALDQNDFRGGVNSGTESTHAFIAAANTNFSQTVDETFLMRFNVQESGGGTISNVDLEFQYNRNTLGWNNITASSAVVIAVSSILVNGNDCTQRIGVGTFLSTNAGQTTDGTSGGNALDYAGNDESETEVSVQIVSGDVGPGDTIQIRLVRDGGTLLDNYNQTPTITVLAPFQADLSTPEFAMAAQDLDVEADFDVNLTTAEFGMNAQTLDVAVVTNIALDTPEFGMNAENLTLIAEFDGDLTTAEFGMNAEDINVNAEFQGELTTPEFGMTAQDIVAETETGIELSTPEFAMNAEDITIPDANIFSLSTPEFGMNGRTLFVSSGNVTRTQQGKRQLAFRIISGQFDNTYDGDIMLACLVDEPGIEAETFNGVLFEWLGLKGFTDATLSGRMQQFAEAGGAFNWSSLGEFTI